MEAQINNATPNLTKYPVNFGMMGKTGMPGVSGFNQVGRTFDKSDPITVVARAGLKTAGQAEVVLSN